MKGRATSLSRVMRRMITAPRLTLLPAIVMFQRQLNSASWEAPAPWNVALSAPLRTSQIETAPYVVVTPRLDHFRYIPNSAGKSATRL
jgi:hypothetical protein